MKAIISSLLLCVLSLGFKNHSTGYQEKLSSFKWLVGTWVANTPQGKYMETWLPMSDTSYAGDVILYKKTTETVNLESIQLVKRNKDLYYIATIKDQNGSKTVEYKVSSFSKNSFVAENPGHDFPRKISYILFKKDSLHAIVEGGSRKRIDYYYGKVKKATPPKPVKK
jgi:hypothetical protein